MSSFGGALTGAGTGAALGSFIPGIGTGIGAGIGGLIGFFKGGRKKAEDDPSSTGIDDLLKKQSDSLGQTASYLQTQGTETLGPAVQYLKQLLGSDPSGVLAATGPERGRVIDQYDTARKSIAEFAPRGGGQTSAVANSYTSEANNLSDIFSSSRREGFQQAEALGTNLEGLGLSAEQLKTSDLNSVLNAVLTRQGFDITKRGQNMEALSGLGEALGMIIAGKIGAKK